MLSKMCHLSMTYFKERNLKRRIENTKVSIQEKAAEIQTLEEIIAELDIFTDIMAEKDYFDNRYETVSARIRQIRAAIDRYVSLKALQVDTFNQNYDPKDHPDDTAWSSADSHSSDE